MSVLIKGMEMPKSCFECALLDCDDVFKCRIGFRSLTQEHGINISRASFCPLIPVPDHGRLIDADALCEGLVSNHPVVIHAKCAPTIIPASGGETDE